MNWKDLHSELSNIVNLTWTKGAEIVSHLTHLQLKLNNMLSINGVMFI